MFPTYMIKVPSAGLDVGATEVNTIELALTALVAFATLFIVLL